VLACHRPQKEPVMKPSFPFLVSMLCASAAFAEPKDASATEQGKAAVSLVETQLLSPLSKARSKRKRFSRAAPMATQLRVRVLDETPQTDVRGKQFLRFAVDERLAWVDDGDWNEATMRGCAYLDEKQVFVRRGGTYV